MLDQVRKSAGETFVPVRAYREDLGPLWSKIDRFDKLERIQHFRQPESASWRAFAAGRWEEALELTEQDRPEVVAEFAEDRRLGYNSYRVRVVEFPIDPYLQWEMHRFKIRVECGENIRVVGPELLARFETHGIVPELIFMGSLAMYEVLYSEAGVLAGGRKFTDSELIAGCRAEVQALYAQGEDFWTFFDREIAPLPPPAGEPEFSTSAGP
ncbi:MAG TPA: hypothetical protein VGX25_19980 [Actinophytocola sp.]|uniref:DUF6879 family protein n=1 Tax=Actinophytocola sp. TaxID=1872138 RepID=UPI002DDD0114|nr:DUF6879 family protein [Actinophytocola sp.]HEV2781670.1 hypothetical protein [Actinophytocola sp.]